MNLSLYLDKLGTLDALWEDGERVFCRGWRAEGSSRSAVLAVLPASERPPAAVLDRLIHEYGLRDELDASWAARPLALARESGRTALLLEDPGGEPLVRLIDGPMEVERFLRLAIGIVTALGNAHDRGLVHKDVKPANILVNCADGRTRLTGFGIASRLPRERQAPEPPEVIAGTLAYMAPEQTGRMNRSINSRSDLYALGVTFYQMLAGSLPFSAADPMEWVHCHIARKPEALSERLESIQAAISGIVMKLLAKAAEDRYQTAAGLERDLRRCLGEWERDGRIEPFALGERDRSDRLIIPEKLYGREHEVEMLLAAFDRVIESGAPELVLVSGYSGIGKSSVVNELHKPLVPRRGLFASGKFDQYKRDIPYATLAQAFQSLIRPLLGKSEADLAPWRAALAEALGQNGQLMVALIPELELLIGTQPSAPELPPQDAQRRFQLVFRRVLGVFARPEHPLALFLDDLQWLDAATLDLVEHLATQPELRHLLLVGAYRDNEVTPAHPLMQRLAAIRSAGGRLQEIVLAPLGLDDVGRLIADALQCTPARAAPLTRLVQEKTAGNPFFSNQFLTALAEEGLLAVDHGAGQWVWDLDRIRAKGYTDNVAELMVGKVRRLPATTQIALRQLSCLGSSAAISTLSQVRAGSESATDAALWEAVRGGLVLRLEGNYRFLHDRVQEAAYALIPECERPAAHLATGRLLAAATLPEAIEEHVFEIVSQLNRGAALITSAEERERLAELNLMAGRRAKASTAYASALTYFTAGAGLLANDCWARRPELTFALELHRAECEFLTGELAAAETRLAVLSARASHKVDRAAVTSLQIDLYTTLGQSDRAVAVGLDYLRHLGLDWSAHPTETEARREYQQVWSQLGGRHIEELIDLPLMHDPAALATLDVLIALVPPAYFTDKQLGFLIACRGVSLSLEHGNSDGSCALYQWFGSIAGARFGNYQAGYRFGRLGCDLVEQRGLKRFQARTLMLFGARLVPWTRHVREGRDLLRRALEAANQSGDLTFAAYSSSALIINLLAAGDPLAEVQHEAEQRLVFAQQMRFGAGMDLITPQLGLVRTLRGVTRRFGVFDDEQLDEGQIERRFSDTPKLALAEGLYRIRKMQARFLSGDHTAAIDESAKAQQLLSGAELHSFESAEYCFYSALAYAASCGDASAGQSQRRRQTLAAHYKQLQVWAESSPANFENRAALVGAEIARLEDRESHAMRLYEQAIRSARANGFIHNEALAYELAGQFYAQRGFPDFADVYLRKARDGYVTWGAEGKVRQLDHLHPHLRQEERAPGPTSMIAAPVEHLDLATVINVSQAVAGEIVFEKLIETLMRTAIEQAGAERGLLIVRRGAEQRIAAEAVTAGDEVIVNLRDEVADATWLPESVLHYVLRTRESVILDDAAVQSSFAEDLYIRERQARSILCLPLINQGKLNGVLYLENHLARSVFAPARTAVVKLLASQAATSLENTGLYRNLEQREAKIRVLFDANIIGIFVGNVEGEIFEANDAFLDLLGYDPEDLASGRLHRNNLVPPDWSDRNARALAEIKTFGTVEGFEKEYLHKDGRRVPVLTGAALFERDRVIAFALDLTERKRAEHALRESEERFRTLMQFSFDVYWETDAQHRFVRQDFSDRVTDGPLPGSELGKTRWELPYLEIDEETWRKHRETLDAHLPFRDLEYARPTPNGGKRYAAVSGLPMFNEAGRFIGYRGVGRHITERKRIEEALRNREKELREIVETIPAMTVTFAPDGQDAFIGKRFSEYSGLSEEDARGSDWKVAIHPDDLDLYLRKWRASIISGDPVEFEARVRRSDGEYRWFLARAVAQRDDRGNILKWYEVLTDIEDRKRAEAEARENERRYREVQMQLAHANRVATMGQLTASIAHEVNQPIAATVTNAQAALRWLGAEPPNLDELEQALGRIVRDGNRAGAVVGRIRNLIKKEPPGNERVDINAAMREVIELTRSEAMKNGVSVQTNLVEGLPPVRGDRVELQQVILNLILNALEAMSEMTGGSRELLIMTGRTEAGDDVLVTVRDSGPGLAPATLEHLFTAFHTTKPNGMGLGLSICRSIIESHGGRLSVSANTPHGAVFQFTLPAPEIVSDR